MTESAVYLYAVTRALPSDGVGDITGLSGEAIRTVEHQGLAAIVSPVSLREFGEEGLRGNLEDLTWLEKVARCHDDVIQQVGARAPVAPLRLATVCFDDAGVRERLDEWHHALADALDRIEGRNEWSVKVYSMPTDDPSNPPDADESGTAYLRRRRAETTRREDETQEASSVADTVHDRLAGYVVASRRLPAQDPRLSGHTGTMFLNGAYLVDDDRSSDFGRLIAALAQEHPTVRIESNGPWPPYSFATLDPE